MGYLGNTPTQQGFIPTVDFFSGNGSTVAFTLSRPVASVAQVQVTIENVPQNPGTAFTVSGNTITFDGAPASGTNNIYVYYTSPITQVIQPGQNTVGTAQIAPGAVIPADLSTGGPSWDSSGNLTATASIKTGNRFFLPSGANFASEIGTNSYIWAGSSNLYIVDQAGNFVRMGIDASGRVTMPFQPAFSANGANSDTTTTATNPLPFNSLSNGIVNSARSAGYNTSTFRFTAPVAGLYFFAATIFTAGGSTYAQVAPYKNGAAIPTTDQLLLFTTPGAGSEMQTGSFIIDLAVNDYVDIRPRVGYNIRMYGGHSFFTGYLIG